VRVGDTAEVCLCDAETDLTGVTPAWVPPDDGEEYLRTFAI